jgi:hypothetical protein
MPKMKPYSMKKHGSKKRISKTLPKPLKNFEGKNEK